MKRKQKSEIRIDDQKSVMRFLQESSIKVSEVLTGILISDKKDWKLSSGKIVQSLLKANFYTQLGREIKEYQNKGKIKEDYFATHKNRVTLMELLKFLDEKVPDEELFTALKSIFLTGIQVGTTQYEEALAYEFLQTAKNLSGTEILILKANFELVLNKELISLDFLANAQSKRSVWKRVVSKQMGYGDLHSIVSKYEKNLEALGLISSRSEDTRFSDEFDVTHKFRLTEMGYKFCEYITKFPASKL